MSRLYSPSEWVAPLVPIASLAILPLGPLFFPRIYLLVLFTYFTVFLYTQVNHVCKFWLTSRKIRRTVRKWNKRLEKKVVATEGNKKQDTEYLNNDTTLDDVEEKLQYYSDPHYFHVFIVPNYSEPEGLLKDTFERIASHRLVIGSYDVYASIY
jgi:hypothetical protein